MHDEIVVVLGKPCLGKGYRYRISCGCSEPEADRDHTKIVNVNRYLGIKQRFKGCLKGDGMCM